MDLVRLVVVVAIIGLLFGCLVIGLAVAGGDQIEARLTEAEADLTEAQAEEMRNRAELTRAKAELTRAEAEADALRTRSEELVKHSRLTRRLLTYSIAKGDILVTVTIVLSLANLATWGVGLWLYRREVRND